MVSSATASSLFIAGLTCAWVVSGRAPASQEVGSLPAAVESFLGASSEDPFGTLHPDAPPETGRFGDLVGVWECTEYRRDPRTGELAPTGQAIWAWKYVLGGFGLQDYWYQPPETYPAAGLLGRGLEMTQLRVYDPQEERWHVAMINNTARRTPGRVFATFTIVEVGEELVMDFGPVRPDREQRIVFHDLAQEEFQWRYEFSTDGGKTWTLGSRIEARRLR